MPVHIGNLWPFRQQAISAPLGEMKLCFCYSCGHVFNQAFEPGRLDYEQPYDNSLFFSAAFKSYADLLSNSLIKKYDLREKRILEIGSGQGDFLKLICETGQNEGVGYDPSYQPDFQHDPIGERLKFVRGYYSTADIDQGFNLVCSRHTLEHLVDPGKLLNVMCQNALRFPQTVFYFEVPNFDYTCRSIALWDLIYEHCQYFTTQSLRYLIEKWGFEILDLYESFSGQYLSVEFRLAQQKNLDFRDGNRDFSKKVHFTQKAHQKIEEWQTTLERVNEKKEQVVIWGAGAKGVSFLNILCAKEIKQVVDINPRKQGMFIPGTGQEIIPPEALLATRPKHVIVMNPVYINEIRDYLKRFDIRSELWLS